MKGWRDTLAFLSRRKTSYQQAFGAAGILGSDAMKDLARYCCAFKTTANPNAELSLVLQGRREVWLRISEHLHLEPEQLATLYGAVTTDQSGE